MRLLSAAALKASSDMRDWISPSISKRLGQNAAPGVATLEENATGPPRRSDRCLHGILSVRSPVLFATK